MKSHKFNATIVLIAALAQVRVRVSSNGAVRRATHKIEILLTPQMKAVHEELNTITNTQGRPLGLGVINGAKHLVLQLDDTAAQKLADTAGVPLASLPMVAKGGQISLTYEHRVPGDRVLNTRTNEEIEIEREHVALQGLEMTIAQSNIQALLVASFTAQALVQQSNQVAAPIAATADVSEEFGEDSPDENDTNAPRGAATAQRVKDAADQDHSGQVAASKQRNAAVQSGNANPAAGKRAPRGAGVNVGAGKAK